jgi:hypothetical protein
VEERDYVCVRKREKERERERKREREREKERERFVTKNDTSHHEWNGRSLREGKKKVKRKKSN